MTNGPSRIFCPGCGKELTSNDRFCPDCGERIAAPPPNGGVSPTVVLPTIDPQQPSSAPTVVYPPPAQPGAFPPPMQPGAFPPPAQPGAFPPPMQPGAFPPPMQPGFEPHGGLQIPAGVPPVAAAPKSGNNRIWWIVGGGCLGLLVLTVCLGVGAFVIFSTGDGGIGGGGGGAVTVTGDRQVLFEDTFNSASASNLGELDDNETRYEYVNGRFEIEVKNEGSLATQTVDQNVTDVAVEVDVVIPDDGGAVAPGLMFGVQDNDNYYVFSIDRDGWYILEALENGQWETLIDWTAGNGISGRQDTLRVEYGNGEMILYVNGVEQDRYSDSRFGAGAVGMLVYNMDTGPVYAAFDNLRIYEGE
jgi:hypothetical protein